MKKMLSQRPKTDVRGVITELKSKKVEEGQKQIYSQNNKVYDYNIYASRPKET
jgi:hypothetical protein